MEHHTTTTRAEAERLLGIAEKLLRNKDFAGCKEFAVLAQETEPLLDGSDQILAVAEVLLASERRIGQQHDWYSILQIAQRTDDSETIKKQYRKLALLLHPDKNKFPFADSAFRLVADAWNVLSDSNKKSLFDSDFSVFTKIDLVAMKRQKDMQQQRTSQTRQQGGDQTDSSQKLPVRRSARASHTTTPNANLGNARVSGAGVGAGAGSGRSNLGSGVGTDSGMRWRRGSTATAFWTACPYCYNLYEYARVYEGCCLKCQNCDRAFTGMEILAMPPRVPGKEAYYCCWGFFPMGFVNGDLEGGGGKRAKTGAGFPNWMPPMFSGNEVQNNAGGAMQSARKVQQNVKVTVPKPGAKKRGRPRKNV